MAGPGTLQYAASVAKNAAAYPKSAEWEKLSQSMCWDAVAHCAHLAGVLDNTRYKAVTGQQTRDNHVLVRTTDPSVANAGAMASVPEGHAICFFTQVKGAWIMIHAMISTGGGMAAGNKNACLGVGAPIGWEVIDLKTLNWGQGFVKRGPEQIHVRHRPITEVA